ncbi:type II toxin-antitoxin system VapB15 family antitoxin [Limnoraphis robusta]|uniref:type II toxin-antitoxin system VapB15 family antitoxin n=1 Tax=Limnoraphis robusta TaxID=1118279 RepID=UPI002B2032B5|nr:hypothetical protein [Limnoraphis robusta]MEA5499004.1 hypothetical protein [Limnoraphis robusta BA-68 BA1]
MTQANFQLSLNFEQVLSLVKQLSDSEKLHLSRELEKEVINSKLTDLLESFRTDEIYLEDITQEVEIVRSEIHARKTTR